MRLILDLTWWRVPIGTRSLLAGVHQVFIHPVTVAIAWHRLYGPPLDPRLWVAFVCHDWGYFSLPDMDGPEGETHPYLGARIMGRFFGDDWGRFTLYHSRFLVKRDHAQYSRLAVADKLAVTVYPPWLYLFLGSISGEIDEYMRTYTKRVLSGQDRIDRGLHAPGDQRDWLRKVTAYLEKWAWEHRDGRSDTWTNREAAPDPQMQGCEAVSTDPLVRSLRGLIREVLGNQVLVLDLLGKTEPITSDDLAIMWDHFTHIYQAALEAMRQIDDPTLVEGQER